MYLLSNEGLHINETYGTAVVLLILVLLINSTVHVRREENYDRAKASFLKNQCRKELHELINSQVKNMDLYYGSFHALKNINIAIPRKRDHGVHRAFRLRQVYFLKTLNRMNDLVEGCRISGDILLDGVDIYG